MNSRVVLVLRGVIGLALVGSLGVQALLGFQLWLDRAEAGFAFEEDAAFLENAGDPFDFAPLN